MYAHLLSMQHLLQVTDAMSTMDTLDKMQAEVQEMQQNNREKVSQGFRFYHEHVGNGMCHPGRHLFTAFILLFCCCFIFLVSIRQIFKFFGDWLHKVKPSHIVACSCVLCANAAMSCILLGIGSVSNRYYNSEGCPLSF